jgi:hypothetical protein
MGKKSGRAHIDNAPPSRMHAKAATLTRQPRSAFGARSSIGAALVSGVGVVEVAELSVLDDVAGAGVDDEVSVDVVAALLLLFAGAAWSLLFAGAVIDWDDVVSAAGAGSVLVDCA